MMSWWSTTEKSLIEVRPVWLRFSARGPFDLDFWPAGRLSFARPAGGPASLRLYLILDWRIKRWKYLLFIKLLTYIWNRDININT